MRHRFVKIAMILGAAAFVTALGNAVEADTGPLGGVQNAGAAATNRTCVAGNNTKFVSFSVTVNGRTGTIDVGSMTTGASAVLGGWLACANGTNVQGGRTSTSRFQDLSVQCASIFTTATQMQWSVRIP